MDRALGNGGNGFRHACRRSRSHRLWRAGVVAALALALMLVAAGSASASVHRSFFGVVPWLSFDNQDLSEVQQVKVRNTRTNFFWPTIEPSRGAFNWSGTDQFVASAAAHHVRVLPFLNGSPSWVTRHERQPPVRTKKARRQWTRFVKACVERYGRNGTFWLAHPTLPRIPITTWQIWNEQNNTKYFSPRPKPRAYAKLLRLAHRAARSQDKRAGIVLGGMFGNPVPKRSISAPRFLKKLYAVKGTKRLFNAVAVHPYAPTIGSLKHQMSALNKVIKGHHDNAKMWITEMGWGSAHPSKRWPLLKGIKGQKRMLQKSFRVLIRHRKQWRLKRVYWFLWRDAAPNAPVNCSFCKSAGLFHYDHTPKPAWTAFRHIVGRSGR
jgi:hypothetical protein